MHKNANEVRPPYVWVMMHTVLSGQGNVNQERNQKLVNVLLLTVQSCMLTGITHQDSCIH